MSQVIALVDDDRNILTSVSIALQAEGFVTRVYTDGYGRSKAIGENPPDLAVFDIKMPQMDGMELLRRLREFSPVPVIFLTSKDDELDEALGLAMGADDYIAKPFSQRLLIARIRAILRRQELAKGEASATSDEPEPPLLERGRLTMDPARHKVVWDGKDVTLTVTEFLILEALAQRPGVVKTRNQLLDVAYHDDVYVDDRTIDSHIKRIRRKFRAQTPNSMRSRPCMASDTNSTTSEDEADLALSWSGRWTLGHRILAVNILTARPARAQRPLPRHLPQPPEQGTLAPDPDRSDHDRPGAGQVPQKEWPGLLAAISTASGSRMRLSGPTARSPPTAGG